MRKLNLCLTLWLSSFALACGGGGGGNNSFDPEDEIGKPCGGIQSDVCSKGLYCQFPGNTCGARNTTGECQLIPEVCTQEINPVCGCDGQTYQNICAAEQNSQSLRPIQDCDSN